MSDSITPWSLEAALYELSKFNDEYKSFITDKEYLVYIKESDSQLIIERASGLLRDAAATTTRLLREGKFDEVDQHRYAQSYLASLAMFYCYKRSRNCDNLSNAYSNLLITVRQALQHNEFENLNLGELLRKSYNKTIGKQNYDRKKDAMRYTPQIVKNKDGKECDIIEDILKGAGRYMNCQRLHSLLNELLCDAVDAYADNKKTGISEIEADIICYTYGFGQGYEKTPNEDIAAKLGGDWTPSNTTQRREKALKRLMEYINTSGKREEFQAIREALTEQASVIFPHYKIEKKEDPFYNEENKL